MAKANVYFFNPTCELAVANGSFSYMAPLLLQEMEKDLSILPFVFATENDFVLTESPPSSAYLQMLRDSGFSLPAFCHLSELEALPSHALSAIYPWGWSPAAHFKLKNLKEKCTGDFRASSVFAWTEDQKLLFERSSSLEFLTKILDENKQNWLINKTNTGVKVTRMEEIEMFLEQYSSIVLKAPLSSSGRGIQIIRRNVLNKSNRQWISGVFKQQNYLIAEPFLEKLTDLSFQFKVLPDSGIDYRGYSIFETNSNGQYKGTWIHPDLKRILPGTDTLVLEEMIRTSAEIIRKTLGNSIYSACHRGFLGVDALILKDQNSLSIQPCIEVNSRMNMGILVLMLEKMLHPESRGKFQLFVGLPGDFMNFAKTQTQLNPPQFKEGKLYSGFLPLVEPDGNKKFGAYISSETAR